VHACKPSYMGGIDERTAVQGPPKAKMQASIQKMTKAKRAENAAQVQGSA
jgi:hypothetical protein